LAVDEEKVQTCAAQWWILEQLHSKTFLAHIGAFPNKCTIKHPFHTTQRLHEKSGNYENYITLLCLEKNKFYDKVILTQKTMHGILSKVAEITI
jgi:hypothetical protein